MQVKDLSVSELKTIIRETVFETLEEYLIDPDEGLELKEEFRQNILEIQRKRREGKKPIPAKEVYKRLGI